MLDSKELADELKHCADGQLSIGDFEEWFALKSWNVHQQGNSDLTDAVFRVEYLFSALNDGHLAPPDVLREFEEVAIAIRPFERVKAAPAPTRDRRRRYRLRTEPVVWQHSKPSEEILNLAIRVGFLPSDENFPISVRVPSFRQMAPRAKFASASS